MDLNRSLSQFGIPSLNPPFSEPFSLTLCRFLVKVNKISLTFVERISIFQYYVYASSWDLRVEAPSPDRKRSFNQAFKKFTFSIRTALIIKSEIKSQLKIFLNEWWQIAPRQESSPYSELNKANYWTTNPRQQHVYWMI